MSMLKILIILSIILIKSIKTDVKYDNEYDLEYDEPVRVAPTSKVPINPPEFTRADNEIALRNAPMSLRNNRQVLKCDPPRWYPYFVAITSENTREIRKTCAGSVLTATTILTAAHCCILEKIIVYVGYMAEKDEFLNIKTVKSVERHPNYDAASSLYDLCVVNLEPPALIISGEVELLRLDQKSIKEISNAEGFFLGYGSNGTVLSHFETMMCFKVTILSEEDCKSKLVQEYGKPPITYDTSTMICGELGLKRTHLGMDFDSGGPLILNDRQIGVVAFAVGMMANGSGTTGSSLVFFTKTDVLMDFVDPMLRSSGRSFMVDLELKMFLFIVLILIF